MNNGICINVTSNTKKLNQQVKFELFLLDIATLEEEELSEEAKILTECDTFTAFAISDAEKENFDEYVNICTRTLKKANVDNVKWNRIVSKGKSTKTGKVDELLNYFYRVLPQNKLFILKIRNNGRSLNNEEVDVLLDIISYSQEAIVFTLENIDGTEDQIYLNIDEIDIKDLDESKDIRDYQKDDIINYIRKTRANELLNEIDIKKIYSTTIPVKASSMAGVNRWYKYDLQVKDADILQDYFFKPALNLVPICTIYNTENKKYRYTVTIENQDNLLEESLIEDFITFIYFLATGK